MSNNVKFQSLAAQKVGGKEDFHVALAITALLALAVGQRPAAVHRGSRLVAAGDERRYRLLAVLRCILLLHELCGVLLLHAKVGERHCKAHEKIVAVAVDELARRGLVYALLCKGKHLFHGPLWAPVLLRCGVVVGYAVVFGTLFAC